MELCSCRPSLSTFSIAKLKTFGESVGLIISGAQVTPTAVLTHILLESVISMNHLATSIYPTLPTRSSLISLPYALQPPSVVTIKMS